MIDPLVEYMVSLEQNNALMAKHNENPMQGAMDYGLDAHDVQLIADNNFSAIKQRCNTGNEAKIVRSFHSEP